MHALPPGMLLADLHGHCCCPSLPVRAAEKGILSIMLTNPLSQVLAMHSGAQPSW